MRPGRSVGEGAADFIKKLGWINTVKVAKGKTFVFGFDGSDDVSNMILSDDNVLQSVVARDPYTTGFNAVDQLVKVICGEARPTGKFEIVPGIILSRQNPEAARK